MLEKGGFMSDDYFADYSTDGLKRMHLALSKAFTEDEAILEKEKKIYCVRETSDWQRWSDGLEAELGKRNEPFEKIGW